MKAEIAESKAAILSMYDVNSWDFLIKFCIATRFRGLTIVGVPYFGSFDPSVSYIREAGLFHHCRSADGSFTPNPLQNYCARPGLDLERAH